MTDDKRTILTAEEIAQRELDASFRTLLAMRDGRRVIYWVLEQAAMYRDAFTGNDATTNYTLGQQVVGRRILERLDTISPLLYPQLLMDIATIREIDRSAAQTLADKMENEDDQDAP